MGLQMSKHCELFDHTADVGLAARADTLGELFEALAEGLAGVICAPEKVSPAEVRPVAVRAEDVEALAVDFLCEVRTVIETDRFHVSAVEVRSVDGGAVEADLLGEPYDESRHEWKTEVKAVTYHELSIARDAGAWTGRIILDL